MKGVNVQLVALGFLPVIFITSTLLFFILIYDHQFKNFHSFRNMPSAYARLQYIKSLQTNLPDQGTDEWLAARTNQFGGSEMATLLNKCPYKSKDDMIADKVTKKRFDAAPCSFGRIFEVVAKKYLREILSYSISDFSGIKSSNYPIAYSPDGIAYRDCEDTLSLIEIKCPYRRRKIKEIPAHYIPQIQTGLNILPVDYGEFIQFRFRLCSLWDVDETAKYNRWIHWESRKHMPDQLPIMYGYIQFTNEGQYEDLGKLPPDRDKELCKLPRCRKSMIHMNEIPKRPYRGKILGFKLFECTNILVERDEQYLKSKEAEIWQGYADLIGSVKSKSKDPELDKAIDKLDAFRFKG